jgi:hypothetical protein
MATSLVLGSELVGGRDPRGSIGSIRQRFDADGRDHRRVPQRRVEVVAAEVGVAAELLLDFRERPAVTAERRAVGADDREPERPVDDLTRPLTGTTRGLRVLSPAGRGRPAEAVGGDELEFGIPGRRRSGGHPWLKTTG